MIDFRARALPNQPTRGGGSAGQHRQLSDCGQFLRVAYEPETANQLALAHRSRRRLCGRAPRARRAPCRPWRAWRSCAAWPKPAWREPPGRPCAAAHRSSALPDVRLESAIELGEPLREGGADRGILDRFHGHKRSGPKPTLRRIWHRYREGRHEARGERRSPVSMASRSRDFAYIAPSSRVRMTSNSCRLLALQHRTHVKRHPTVAPPTPNAACLPEADATGVR